VKLTSAPKGCAKRRAYFMKRTKLLLAFLLLFIFSSALLQTWAAQTNFQESNSAEDYLKKAMDYTEARRYAEAIEAYKKAVSIKPDYVDAQYGPGVSYLWPGNREAVQEQYNLLKTLDQDKAAELLKEINK
jgi:Tfp pilus assembly protein PilF